MKRKSAFPKGRRQPTHIWIGEIPCPPWENATIAAGTQPPAKEN